MNMRKIKVFKKIAGSAYSDFLMDFIMLHELKKFMDIKMFMNLKKVCLFCGFQIKL